jgi:hypothetical protein
MKIQSSFLLPAALLSVALACSSAGPLPDGIGEARMEVTQVPPGVGCLHVVAAATRTVQFDFNVSPGSMSVMNLSGLPTGRVDFGGSAFANQCPPAAGAVPSWVSDPVTATITPTGVSQVTLVMHQNGRAQVGVDFGNEPPCLANGAACQNSSACCSAICVSDANGNGSCAQPNGGACMAPHVPCPGPGGMPVCVDTTSDPTNCGMCGAQCPMGTSCVNGVCAMACPSGFAVCGGMCVNVGLDPNNCGMCGAHCPMGANCVNGACACVPGSVSCGGVCVNLTSDPNNCGACGVHCSGGTSTCVAGVCTAPPGMCAPPSLNCPDAMGTPRCIDPANDANNCGACGNRCPPGIACQNGTCGMPCAPPRQTCMSMTGPVCSNLQTDPLDCGACNVVCPPGRACVGGVCH